MIVVWFDDDVLQLFVLFISDMHILPHRIKSSSVDYYCREGLKRGKDIIKMFMAHIKMLECIISNYKHHMTDFFALV